MKRSGCRELLNLSATWDVHVACKRAGSVMGLQSPSKHESLGITKLETSEISSLAFVHLYLGVSQCRQQCITGLHLMKGQLMDVCGHVGLYISVMEREAYLYTYIDTHL